MSDIVIRTEGLSKKYVIGHQAERERYTTLRDVIIRNTKGLWRKTRDLVHGRPMIQGDELEEVWALKDVSIEVRRGEVLGIIGRNGAGKSTLLKVLSRITEPSEGRVRIKGRIACLLEVGTGFHPELSGRENIYLNGAILGMSQTEIRRKFDEIVTFAEVERYLDTPVKRYSSGMYVRLAFAVAAHLEPEILVVDEVLAVGDAEFQKKCLGKMERVANEGRTVLVVSHNMASILNLCHQAVLLNAGRVVADGRPAEIVNQYLASEYPVGGEVTWNDPADAPGSAIVRLHSVRILQDGTDGPTVDVDISKEVRIQVSYWNLQEGTLLYSNISLLDQIGTWVLSTSNHRSVSLTEDPWFGKPHPVGLFESVCCIPGNFLNEGYYSVRVTLGTDTSNTQVAEDQVLSFCVHDTGEMRKEYYGGWPGTVRPRLAWHTAYIGPAPAC